MQSFDGWVDEFSWDADSNVIFFTSDEGGETPLSKVGRLGDFVELATHGELADLHPIADKRLLVASRRTAEMPSEVVLVHLDQTAFPSIRDAQLGFSPSMKYLSNERAVDQVTHLNDALLAQLDLPKMESFWFSAKDGTKLEGFLIRPPGFDAAKKYPVKFLIHGGPQGAWGDDWSYRWNADSSPPMATSSS